jgi:two-component system NarL family sensor kinase
MTVGPPTVNDGGVQPDDVVDRFPRRLAAAGRPAIAALVAGLAALALALAAFLAILVQPHDNLLVSTARGSFQDGGIRIEAARGDDIQDGDVVVAVDGIDVDELARHPFTEQVDAIDGENLTYDVRRDGEVIQVDVHIGSRDAGTVVGSTWSGAVLVPVLALMGALLLWRRPELAAARTLFVVGSFAVLAWVLSTHGPSPIDLAAGRWWFLFGGLALFVCEVGLLYFVVVLTDDPRAPGAPRGRPRKARLPLVSVVAALAFATDAIIGATTASSPVERLGAICFPRLEPLIVAATLAVAIVRYRRATSDITRRQLRLVAWQLVVSGVLFIALFALPEALGGETLLPVGLAAVPFWSFPPVLAVAVLRFDLFEIRFLVQRSMLYVSLTAIVAGIYVVVVAGLSALLGQRAGVGVGAVAAGVVAIAVHPLRVRLQRGVDRLVYGTTAEPAEVLAELGRRLEDHGASDALLDTVVETVARSLGRSFVAIEVDEEEDREVVASFGDPTGNGTQVPLLHQGREVGRLIVGLPSTHEMGPAEQRLLVGVAAHIGTAVAAARLTVDLRRSRERLVSALEDERRRLGRDLHDGLGPRLAAAAMKLEAAGRMTRRDLDAALVLHDEVRAELNEVIADVRRIVYALRPAALDQLGLVGALREQANRLAGRVNGNSVELLVNVRGTLPELPAAVEVAAFRIASEAMTNAVRHASASRCEVVLSADHALELAVVDDGIGIPDALRAGVGVLSMRERADELGGTMSVRRNAPRGTIVTATLPLGEP